MRERQQLPGSGLHRRQLLDGSDGLRAVVGRGGKAISVRPGPVGLLELERKQEEERRKQLLELEKLAREAAVSFAELRVSKGLDEAAIERALLGERAAFAGCFEREQSGWTLHYRLEFGADGALSAVSRVAATRASGSADDPEHAQVHACVERGLRQVGWVGLIGGGAAVIELEVVFDYP